MYTNLSHRAGQVAPGTDLRSRSLSSCRPTADCLHPPSSLMPINPCRLARMVVPTRRDDNELLGSWLALLGRKSSSQMRCIFDSLHVSDDVDARVTSRSFSSADSSEFQEAKAPLKSPFPFPIFSDLQTLCHGDAAASDIIVLGFGDEAVLIPATSTNRREPLRRASTSSPITAHFFDP
jgi:hypothetical protein